MNSFVGVTDDNWFAFLAAQEGLDEVNFWQPGGSHVFRALDPNELFLFKLHSPRNFIVGGGFFAYSSLCPVSLAWETFEKANGAESLDQLRVLIGRHRRHALDPLEDPNIGCIILEQPFFLPESRWIPLSDWKPNIVQGRTYDLSSREGRALWDRLQAALLASNVNVLGTETGVLTGDARPMADLPIAGSVGAEQDRFGSPVLVTPRLGQGAFRILVTDVYKRRCAVTRERTLPALEAAHIRPYGEGGAHRVDNGLLLRRDLHTLLDRGYVTVTTDYHLEVSRRIKEEFENGRDYYALHGRELSLPPKASQRPSPEFLRWHSETRFRG